MITPVVGTLLAVGLLTAMLDWVAVAQARKRLEYGFKPGAMTLFIAAAVVLAAGRGFDRLSLWFLAGLVASLAGDIFLMLPAERWFIAGLLSFLAGHVAYIGGLNPTAPPLATLGVVALVALLDAFILPRILAGLKRSGHVALRGPVVIYAAVLSLTLVSGWATWLRPDWTWGGRAVVAAGATLFFASDLMLAWNRFVRASRTLHVAVIVTYHLAQLALTATIALAP